MQKGHIVTENKLLVEVWMRRFQFSLRGWPMGVYGSIWEYMGNINGTCRSSSSSSSSSSFPSFSSLLFWKRGHKDGQADLGGLGSECYWGA